MASVNTGRQGSAGKTSPVPHTRVEDQTKIDAKYEIGEKLGQGSFGVVHLATHRKSSETWACKIVNKEKAGSSAIKLLEREVSILKRVHHEHIIQLKEVFETSKRMYLIMEYCQNGELADVLKEGRTFSEEQTRTIMSRLASAIAYLHKNDMVHRDLKLENILLGKNPMNNTDDLYIKVTDFGLSVVKGGVGHENMMADFCGTPMYMAPEIIDNKTYSEKCDIWAMGVIMYILLSGLPPFRSNDEEKLYEIIKSADVDKMVANDPSFARISAEACDCVCGMLKGNPAHRVTAGELVDHAWITGKSLEKTQRPKNVLEMMKEFGRDQSSSVEENTINGNQTGSLSSASNSGGTSSNSSSREGSTGSTKRNKLSPGGDTAESRRTKSAGNVKPPAAKKPLPRVATEPEISSAGRTSVQANRSRLRANSAGNIKSVASKKSHPGMARDPSSGIGSAKSRLRTNSAGNILVKSVATKKPIRQVSSEAQLESSHYLSPAAGIDNTKLRRSSMGNLRSASPRKPRTILDTDLDEEGPEFSTNDSPVAGIDNTKLRRSSMGNLRSTSPRKPRTILNTDLDEEGPEFSTNDMSPNKTVSRLSHHGSTGNLTTPAGSGTKSKSPISREGTARTAATGRLNSHPHHAIRPAATRTSNGAAQTAPENKTKKKSR